VPVEFSMDQLTQEPNQIELLLQQCSEALNRESKPVVLFGSGIIGRFYLGFLKKLNIPIEIYFCDNDPSIWGTYIEGVPVISFNELKSKYRDSYIIITSFQYYDEISLQLKENKLSVLLNPDTHRVILDTEYILNLFDDYIPLIRQHTDQFQSAYRLLSDELSKRIFYDRINYSITANSNYLTPLKSNSPQYFAPDIIKLSDKEVFVDGGGYTGDTVEEFLKQTEGKFDKIYSFEPERSKHKEFHEKFRAINHIELVPFGLWSKKDVLKFHSNNDITSFLGEDGDIEIPATSIDERLNGDPVTFIKMDIEGAELEALKGAATSIKKYKPKLAICVYHRSLDMVEIPLFLKELVPEYKIYLRHYSVNICETVCYAVVE
jgi:FkbM family methyltransferase